MKPQNTLNIKNILILFMWNLHMNVSTMVIIQNKYIIKQALKEEDYNAKNVPFHYLLVEMFF